MEEFNSRNSKKVLINADNFNTVIVGCGGLGSNIAQMLVRSGISKLKIIDFDIVNESNLNRQFFFLKDLGKNKTDALDENLKMINPSVVLTKVNAKVTAENFKETVGNFDILIEACDSVESKKILLECFLKDNLSGRYFVCGSGMAGIEDSNMISTKKLGDNIFICGDGITGFSKEIGIMSPRVLITAGHQANTVLRIIAGEK